MSVCKSFLTISLLAASGLPAPGATIGINFSGGSTFVHEIIDSTENTNTLDGITGTGTPVWYNLFGATGTGAPAGLLTVDWNSAGTYSAGRENLTGSDASQQVFRGYLDDGDGVDGTTTSYKPNDGYGVSIEITGLSSWLSSVGATSYTVTLLQNTDWGYFITSPRFTDFTDVEVRSGLLNGSNAIASLPLLHTFNATPADFEDWAFPTGDNSGVNTARRGVGTRYWQQANGFASNSITVAAFAKPGPPAVDPGPRGSIAAIIISTDPVVNIPEPSAGLMLLILGAAATIARIRK